MPTITTYTASITVPVYAAWKCKKCGEVNLSTGGICCERKESTKPLLSFMEDKVRERVVDQVELEWTGIAFDIINDPNHSGNSMYNSFFLPNAKCIKCGRKPCWNKNTHPIFKWFLYAMIFGGPLLLSIQNVMAWLAFWACVGVMIWIAVRKPYYIKMMTKLPKEYTPVIGTNNSTLIWYAKAYGKKILSSEQCIAVVKGEDPSKVVSKLPNAQSAVKTTAPVKKPAPQAAFTPPKMQSAAPVNKPALQANFCRKCGAQLLADTKYCRKCGTEIIKR